MTSKYAINYEIPRHPITAEDKDSIAEALADLGEQHERAQIAALPTEEIEIQTQAPALTEQELALAALYDALPLK